MLTIEIHVPQHENNTASTHTKNRAAAKTSSSPRKETTLISGIVKRIKNWQMEPNRSKTNGF